MGDIADMMLDGTLCETCGEFLDGDAPGHPRQCHDCRNPPDRTGKLQCSICGKWFAGVEAHQWAKHPKRMARDQARKS